MIYVRERYYVLEAIVFAFEAAFFGSFIWLLAGVSTNDAVGAAGTVFSGFIFGFFAGIWLWFVWAVIWRWMWTSWPRWSCWIGALLTYGMFPLAMLIVDLNARFVVRRFYTGDRPIPYVFLVRKNGLIAKQ